MSGHRKPEPHDKTSHGSQDPARAQEQVFSQADTARLRSLAERVAGIAARPDMTAKAKLWTAHNDLETDEPLVFIDPENSWDEIIPPHTLQCSNTQAREWERRLAKEIHWAEVLKDDKVIEPFFDVPHVYTDDGWGLDIRRIGGGNGGSYIVKPMLVDYDKDLSRIHHPCFHVDQKASEALLELAQNVFSGILTVRQRTAWWWSLGMTNNYIALRGLENFLCDMIEQPEWVHRMMNLLCEGKLAMIKEMEAKGLLSPNTGGTYVGSGGFGFTRQLPCARQTEAASLRGMWGFCESQETSSVSPDMYAEFIFPYHLRLLEHFGLNCYGCCEAYESRWRCIRQIPRLRRVSVAPWSDFGTVPDNLGKQYIASVKLKPTPLAESRMNTAVVRADCRSAAQQTRGGICEFIMKDNHTLGGCADNAVRWVQIMREEIDRVYAGNG